MFSIGSQNASYLVNNNPLPWAIVAGNHPSCDSSPIQCEEVKDVARLVASLPHSVACESPIQPDQGTREGRFNMWMRHVIMVFIVAKHRV